MNEPRLDRLSALLEGLRPHVRLSDKGNDFSLRITRCIGAQNDVNKLRLMAIPARHSWQEHLLPNEACWMSFEVSFDGPIGSAFLAEFPHAVCIPLNEADPSLFQIVTLIASEMQTARCGQPLLMNRAGDILLIGLMRHLVSNPLKTTGLFSALANSRIAKSLVALHTDTAHPWTLEHLADLAGMSRTSFANKFKEIMKISPGRYLENLRLSMANQLVTEGVGLKQIARSTGYSSPSTLSRALSRWHRSYAIDTVLQNRIERSTEGFSQTACK